MCVIIIKQQGLKMSEEIAKTSGRINPHGLGIIWMDTFEVSYHKSKDYKLLLTDRPFIAHFRYATVGAINKDNTHPFQCGANKNEWLMMNGTIRSLGNAKISDSKALANKLGNLPRHTWKKELEAYTCRFVTVNTRSRTYQVYNRDLWTYHEGIWYSKADVIEDTLIAVYGTLKKGNSNYYHYLTDSKFLGHGYTQHKYPLIIDGLPYMVDKKGTGHHVEVDVFKINRVTLDAIDRLEGHPRWYERKKVNVIVKGRVLECWLYFNPKDIKGETLHRSYSQPSYKPKQSLSKDALEHKGYSRLSGLPFGWEDESHDTGCCSTQTYKPSAAYRQMQLDKLVIPEERTLFDESKEPICVNCFGDLEHDGYEHYYCMKCQDWFTKNELLYSL